MDAIQSSRTGIQPTFLPPWIPPANCAERESNRSIVEPFGRKFSPTCKQAMDGDVALVVPWTSGLNLVAMALLGVAWLTLVE